MVLLIITSSLHGFFAKEDDLAEILARIERLALPVRVSFAEEICSEHSVTSYKNSPTLWEHGAGVSNVTNCSRCDQSIKVSDGNWRWHGDPMADEFLCSSCFEQGGVSYPMQ